MRTGRARVAVTAASACLLLPLVVACAASTPAAPAPSAPAPSAPAPSASAPPPVFARAARSTTDPASLWVVVNKQHPVRPQRYAPARLVTVDGRRVSAAVADDLATLRDVARADGVVLPLASAYRSYSYQVGVHARLVRRDGAAGADRVSARPGYSEHQTGLAVDFGSSTVPRCTLRNCFATTAEGRWLDAHAGEHGFLRRYTAEDTALTGYASESWHYRWVGRDLAAEMARARVRTLEDFFGVGGGPVYAPSRE